MCEHNEILLTIIIPTKNRPVTAMHAIQTTINNIQTSDIEIIVHDCSDNNDLEERAGKITDKRLKYYHVAPTDMTDNWNQAMEKITGKYFTIIGDDDAVLPNISETTRWALQNNIACITHSCSATYYWPNFPDKKIAGKLISSEKVRKQYNETFQKKNIGKDTFQRLSYNCGEFNDLPIVYHSILHTDVFKRIKVQTGVYFDSMCPDVYSGYVIANEIDFFYYSNKPFTIIGKSGEANSGRVKTNDRTTIFKHINEFKTNKWPDFLPISKDYHVILAHTQFIAFNNLKMDELNNNFNLNKTIALCIVSEPRYAFDVMRKYINQVTKNKIAICMQLLKNIAIIILYNIKMKYKKAFFKTDCLIKEAIAQDISEAILLYINDFDVKVK